MLVRMPFTPLRHDGAVLDEAAWRPLVGRARSACEAGGFEFRLAVEWEQYLLTQSIGSDGYDTHGLLEGTPLEAWLAEHGPALAAEKPPGFPFAFGFLDEEETRQSLHRQYLSAVRRATCPMRAKRIAPTGIRSPWPLPRGLRP